MSRHRHVRALRHDDYDYDEEEEDYYDDSAHGSPSLNEYMYNRGQHRTLDAFVPDEAPDDDDTGELAEALAQSTLDQQPTFTENDVLLAVGIDDVLGVLGDDQYSEEQIRVALRKHNYNADEAIEFLISHVDEYPAARAEFGDHRVISSQTAQTPATTKPTTTTTTLLPSTQTTATTASKPVTAQPAITATTATVTAQPQPPAKQATVEPSAMARALMSDEGADEIAAQFSRSFLKGAPLQPFTAAPEGLKRYDFSEPSPDDVAIQRRAQLAGGKVTGIPGVAPTTPAKPAKSPAEKRASVSTPSPAAAPADGASPGLALKSPAIAMAKPMPRQSASRNKDADAALKEFKADKVSMNLVVIGHVDAGKSTLMGHVLYDLGHVSQKIMHKYEKESTQIGKATFAFAWVLDAHDEERSRGITMDIGMTSFETEHRRITLLDAPGHRDFIPNMISGAAQADVALLLVDSVSGGFESGFEQGGQTKEHALLARALGVNELVVVVNKLDMCQWSQERYDMIVGEMSNFLIKQANFAKSKISFVPCSGLVGENLVKRKDPLLTAWYTGPTLLELIDGLTPPTRAVDLPFRMSVSDVYKTMALGLTVTGRVEAGVVCIGDKLLLMPAGSEVLQVKGIEVHDKSCKFAHAGDNVELGVTNVSQEQIGQGNVLCDPERPIPICRTFQAKIVTFNNESVLTPGFPVVLHTQSLNEPAVVLKLVSQLDKDGQPMNKGRPPRWIPRNASAVVIIKPERPICIEMYATYRQLGRFTLRAEGKTLAAGIVTELTS
eukprot:TRINITY_DN2549_c0_g1_i1.p1 TRINITY_DN2549_c0_g1~~TRINITY_DN2549_c0_g1_i1.p1  ORF type:complete len:781 (+),score=188.02 TRINITY_DN2549_c0_g1_i1:126-2468(+)